MQNSSEFHFNDYLLATAIIISGTNYKKIGPNVQSPLA